ncbi:MAG: hypothetical protein M1483_01760 [Actinobacteria bacterium]|nr:hypothetical protein [Actinomycetota bacterium]MCL6104356.1 hypothetical protein [Actinomycetota bacterium]
MPLVILLSGNVRELVEWQVLTDAPFILNAHKIAVQQYIKLPNGIDDVQFKVKSEKLLTTHPIYVIIDLHSHNYNYGDIRENDKNYSHK